MCVLPVGHRGHGDGRLCVLPRDSACGDQHHDVGVHVQIRQRVWLESVGVRHCLARLGLYPQLFVKCPQAAATLSSRERERDPHTASWTHRWTHRVQECRGEEEGGKGRGRERETWGVAYPGDLPDMSCSRCSVHLYEITFYMHDTLRT